MSQYLRAHEACVVTTRVLYAIAAMTTSAAGAGESDGGMTVVFRAVFVCNQA